MRAYEDWCEAWAREALRVLKPGGWLLAFGGTRTWHRLVCAIEDAGFEIRDTAADLKHGERDSFPALLWINGAGFPKGKNVEAAIEAELRKPFGGIGPLEVHDQARAEEWHGYNVALKPAFEPICIARAPLSEANVAANVLKHGTGALNIDASRIGTESTERPTGDHSYGKDSGWNKHNLKNIVGGSKAGRYPSNLLLSHTLWCQSRGTARVPNPSGRNATPKKNGSVYAQDDYTQTRMLRSTVRHADADGLEAVEVYECVAECPIFILDQQSGARKSGARALGTRQGLGYGGAKGDGGPAIEASEGTASRFFARFAYVSKASRREREAGLEDLPLTTVNDGRDTEMDTPYQRGETKRRNTHPTVKPLDLCSYLVKLVTPPGGVVLDPFMGSGSVGCAAAREGFSFVGIEQDEEYVRIAERRIEYWSNQRGNS